MSQPSVPHQDRRLFAIGIILITYVFFTCCDIAAKWLVTSGMPPLQAAFARFTVQFAFMLGLALPRTGLGVFRGNNLLLLVVRGSMLLSMTTLNFISLMYLPLTVTSAVMFTIPLMVTALSVPILGEQVGWRRWLAIFVGFIGVLIIVQPWDAQFHWAVFLMLGCSFAGAVYYTLTRKLAGREAAITMQLYVGLVGMLGLLPFVIAGWTWPGSPLAWLMFLGVGLAAMTGHQIAIIAHRYAPASVLAPFGYSQIIWMSLGSWLIFAQPPDIWLFAGAPIVIASGLYIWMRERELAKATVTPVSPPAADEIIENPVKSKL